MTAPLFPALPTVRAHPLRGGPVLTDGSTCGTCRHLDSSREKLSGGIYHKCRLVGATRGSATDVRLRWPGCLGWEAKP